LNGQGDVSSAAAVSHGRIATLAFRESASFSRAHNSLMKLDLPEGEDGHRRVLAVLAHLSTTHHQ
jgi:hypothetical protein